MTTTRTIALAPHHVQQFAKLIQANIAEVLQIESCRRYLARTRWEEAGKPLTVFEDTTNGVMPGTVAHNRRELEEEIFGSSKRTQRLIGPLSALDPVYGSAAKLSALSIGPRTEMELLHLVGIGFHPENLRAVDLISSSPLMDLGDMHNLPYEDRSFDVVISGWVLTYSKDPQKAVSEMVRVCKHRGLIAIGVTYDPTYSAHYIANPTDEKEIVGSMHRSVDHIAKMIGPKLERICFQQDPVADQIKGPVMLIARINHG